jgi:NADH-quinone oxidoreductase subunit C
VAKLVLDTLQKKFGDAIERVESAHGDETAVVKAARLAEVATFLRDDPAMAFDAPVFVTATDVLHWQPVGPTTPDTRPDFDGGAPGAARFEVTYQLRSTAKKHRIRLKILLPEAKAALPSLALLWPGFLWQERETFDMYGIRFEGHPDLRRIYLYDEFVGYPLRKDYPKEKRQPLVRRSDLVGDHNG